MIDLKAYDDDGGYVLQRDQESGELIWVFKAYARSDEEFLESAMHLPALSIKKMEEKEIIRDLPLRQNGSGYREFPYFFRTSIMFKKFDESDLELP